MDGGAPGASPGSPSPPPWSPRSSPASSVSRHPMLDVRLFRNLRFSAASGAVTVSFFTLLGFIFLITQYFQFIRGYGPLSTGVHLLPVALAVGIGSVAGTQLAVRAGTKLVVAAGLVAMAASTPGRRPRRPRASATASSPSRWCCTGSAWGSRPPRRPSPSWGPCRGGRPGSGPRSTTPPACSAAPWGSP